jgi:hypothetical protein
MKAAKQTVGEASRELLRRRELVPEHERAKALAAQWGIDPDFRAPANLPISIHDLRNGLTSIIIDETWHVLGA